MSEEPKRWTEGHPDGPRVDVDGVAWYACDPYPTWYRREGDRVVTGSPEFAGTGAEGIDQVVEVLRQHMPGPPQGGIAGGAWMECRCGTTVNGASRDHAQLQMRRHLARALAEAGLLTGALRGLEEDS